MLDLQAYLAERMRPVAVMIDGRQWYLRRPNVLRYERLRQWLASRPQEWSEDNWQAVAVVAALLCDETGTQDADIEQVKELPLDVIASLFMHAMPLLAKKNSETPNGSHAD